MQVGSKMLLSFYLRTNLRIIRYLYPFNLKEGEIIPAVAGDSHLLQH